MSVPSPGVDLARPAPVLAPDLLGCEVHCGPVRARITEVEAYQGEDDLACHASRGCTPRTAMLYREPGTLYCYLCYGIHVLLNLVCDRRDEPAAVLVRSVLVLAGEDLVRERRRQATVPLAQLANGPGKLTQALGLGLEANGTRLGTRDCPLRLVPGDPPAAITVGPRVGVAYAGEHWAGMPWRFHERGFPVARG